MAEYTEEDIIKHVALRKLNGKSRIRKIIDPRNYLINLLYYRFDWTQERIAALFEIHRTTMLHAKDMAYNLEKDPGFIQNTKQERAAFPWEAVSKESLCGINQHKRLKPVIMQLTRQEFDMLNKYRKKIKLTSIGGAARTFLVSNLNILKELYDEQKQETDTGTP